jgi:nucleoside-diphosphate kinase
MEKSLVILKPDTIERKLVGTVISRFEAAGLDVVASKVVKPTDEQIDKHYQIDNADYCTSIGCKSASIPVITYQEAITTYSLERAEELKNMGVSVLGWNRDYMKRKPLISFIVQGNKAISRIRAIIGSTNPPNAAPGTIRFEYGVDSIEQANLEHRGAENLVHASGAIDEAEREIEIWFPELLN